MDEAKQFKQRSNIGSRVTREGHARFWERPEVKFLRATRHEDAFPPPRLSVRCRFGQGTFAGTRRNGRDAPKD